MSAHAQQVFLAARIPVSLKEKLADYCENHGIKMNYFIAKAIQEMLQEAAEDSQDIAMARERLKTAEFVSQKEFDRYLSKRNIR
jgi:predicted DNA-binding protein